ncbi:MAG: hypothetical protein KGQ41_06830 [Alphaproteobacteria bacterium]|nr:hypothetical protein [Alphaproteobacteria bacterium]
MLGEVVIIGGGPIGCWTALQIKMRNPKARITVYERKARYERDHVLSIKKASFLQWSKGGEHNTEFMRAIFGAQAILQIADGKSPNIDDIPNNRLAYWRHLPRILDIRTIDFERILKAECLRQGITHINAEVKSPDDIMAAHPACDTFIAADGAHSKMRTAIFGKDSLTTRDIYPSFDFNWVAVGQPTLLRINTFDKLGRPYAENIGMMGDNGKTHVNERLIASWAEYAAMPKATFKEPLIVTPDAPFWDAMPKSRRYNGRTLKDDFYDLVRLRAQHAGEVIDETQPIKLSKVPLSQYCAKRFAKQVNHNGKTRTWYLVGDAAMGMPFYRSVNSGLILGAQLGYLLSTRFENKAAIYNHFTRPFRIAREFINIRRTEYKILMYKEVWRPLMHRLAKGPLAPLVKWPTDWAVKHLKYGKCS